MNRLHLAALIAGLSITASALGADEKKEIQANYDGITAAMKKQDIKWIGAMLDPNFEAHSDAGMTLNKAKVLADYASQMKIIRNISWVRTIRKIEHKGPVSLVTVDGLMKGDMNGMDSKPHKFTFTATALDSWTKKAGKWTILRTTMLKHQLFVDGKLMNRPKAN